MSIGQRLRYARELRGWTQSGLARRVRLRPQTVQAIEAGHVRRPRSLLELARALQVGPDWLLEGRGAMRGEQVCEVAPEYRREDTLSEEAADLARLWMALPESQREALRALLLALRRP